MPKEMVQFDDWHKEIIDQATNRVEKICEETNREQSYSNFIEMRHWLEAEVLQRLRNEQLPADYMEELDLNKDVAAQVVNDILGHAGNKYTMSPDTEKRQERMDRWSLAYAKHIERFLDADKTMSSWAQRTLVQLAQQSSGKQK